MMECGQHPIYYYIHILLKLLAQTNKKHLKYTFFLSQVGLLGEAHSTCAQYLFQQDKIYDVSYDKGDKSLQCGRKMDAFKLWVRKLITCFLL